MNETTRYARRYHWLGEAVTSFVNDPHTTIQPETSGPALNLVAGESDPARTTIAEIALNERPENILTDAKRIKILHLPSRHYLTTEDLHPVSLNKIMLSICERQPEGFEQLLALPGVGAKTFRALSLISELVHGITPRYRDPARYSFAHGGKDGIPYPVDRKTYDQSIELLRKAIHKTKQNRREE